MTEANANEMKPGTDGAAQLHYEFRTRYFLRLAGGLELEGFADVVPLRVVPVRREDIAGEARSPQGAPLVHLIPWTSIIYMTELAPGESLVDDK